MNLTKILEMVSECPTVSVADGEKIIVEGSSATPLFVLRSGELEVRRSGRAVVRITDPGAVVGEIGLLLDQDASADVVGVGETVVHQIENTEELFSRYPEFMALLAEMLAHRLWQVSTYLHDLQEQFADSSATLGLVPTVLKELLDNPVSHHDVGSEREPDSPY